MFWSTNPTIIQKQTSKTSQKWVTEHKTKLLLWPFQSPDVNPVENDCGELKRRSTIKDLEWFWMKEWFLVSCQVFSNLIRHYRRKFRAVKLACTVLFIRFAFLACNINKQQAKLCSWARIWAPCSFNSPMCGLHNQTLRPLNRVKL